MTSVRLYGLLNRALAQVDSFLGPNSRILQYRIRRRVRREYGVDLRCNADAWDLIRCERMIRIRGSHWPFARGIAMDFDSYFSFMVSEHDMLDFSHAAVQRYRESGLEFLLTSLPEEPTAIDSYFVNSRPVPGGLVFDIGANCGVTAHKLASMVGPSGRVIAFEPDPMNFEALLANIERHKLSNVVAVQKAISGRHGSAAFNAEGTLGSGLESSVARPGISKTVTVECITLADAIASFGAPTFIKIDVEGEELSILHQSRETLMFHKSSFALDTGHIVDGEFTAERAESIFASCGYKTGTIRQLGGYITTWAVPT